MSKITPGTIRILAKGSMYEKEFNDCADEIDRISAQRDELLAAAKTLLEGKPGIGGGRIILEADCIKLAEAIAEAEAI
jgi:hypothetical protein